MSEPSTVAGWYADPNNADSLRYWDGSAWTDRVEPAPTPGASAPKPRSPWLWIGLGAGVAVVLGLIGAGVVAITNANSDNSPGTTVADDDPPAPTDREDTSPSVASDGTLLVADETFSVMLPEGWIVAPEDALMRATFKSSFGDTIEFSGMWAEDTRPGSGRVLVQAVNVPATEEAMLTGAAAAEANLIATSDSVETHEQTLRSTSAGLPAISQSFVVEQGGLTLATTVVIVDLGDWTFQLTLIGDSSVEELETVGWEMADTMQASE